MYIYVIDNLAHQYKNVTTIIYETKATSTLQIHQFNLFYSVVSAFSTEHEISAIQGCIKPSMKVFKYKHKPFTIMFITSPSRSTNFEEVFKYKPKPFVSVIDSF